MVGSCVRKDTVHNDTPHPVGTAISLAGRDDLWCSTCFLLMIKWGIPARGMVLPTVRVVALWKCPHRHTWSTSPRGVPIQSSVKMISDTVFATEWTVPQELRSQLCNRCQLASREAVSSHSVPHWHPEESSWGHSDCLI